MITDPRIVNFCNEKLRVCADAQGQALATSIRFLEHVKADLINQVLANLDDNEIIDDGSFTDGRTPITVGAVKQYIANTQAYLDQLLVPDQNGFTMKDNIYYVAVNESSKL